ncbi:hypothetical protein KIN20_026104 [Parelaphostrongylus tenuis]|uniref:Uncharacterized protein n=1 Tax=Parelaphostrongylus tenuis TaxID=148309 RepID=A0AAD5QXA4_PARTN|nr:hypothetical protein KIN20_026104 [Parelaphostrongylus tenuis]
MYGPLRGGLWRVRPPRVRRFFGTSSSLMAELEVQEASNHVYHVQLNRPDRRNTFTLDLWKNMKTVFDELAEEPKCRAIVISGIGKSFCAGIDLQQGMGEVNIGIAADVGTLNRIQKIVANDSWTRELAFTARDVGADEALKFGLISRIFSTQESVVEGALALAERIVKKSPIAVQGTKVVLNHARDHAVQESLDFVKTWEYESVTVYRFATECSCCHK